jgi:putative ABC transport system permease protein
MDKLTTWTYVRQSLLHYRKLNLSVVLGIALGTAILVGALVVGDSVRYTLLQLVQQRLGKTSRVITAGERLFSRQLAAGIAGKTGAKTTALLRSNGFGVIGGGESRVNQLAVWGVDSLFGQFGADPGQYNFQENEVAINEEVARLTGLKPGDEFLLRVNKLNTFPANTPFVSVKENSVAVYVKIKHIVKANELGNFQLQNSQSAPRNLFGNIEWLNRLMQLQAKANVILVGESYTGNDLEHLLRSQWQLADLNLQIRENALLDYTELISDRVFVEPFVEQFCRQHIPGSNPHFSYFINSFSANGRSTPYSFVSSDPELKGQQLDVSEWLVEDLQLKTNDSVRISYFEVGPQRRLVEKDTVFVVSRHFEQVGERADKNLMPVIPGLSDAGNCRDWKTGVPVDLKKIRPKDEAYWKSSGGAPKAFVSLATAQKLWGNRFGETTAIRISGLRAADLAQTILAGLDPTDAGYQISDAKTEGDQAASTGVDFGQLFIGLSFFVLFAAVLLTIILFRLFLNYRKTEIGTMSALGFSIPLLRKLYLKEAGIYVFTGILVGIPLGIGYNYMILRAVNTIWVDIVRTSAVQMHLTLTSILVGSVVIGLVSLATIWMVLNRFLKKQLVSLQRKSAAESATTGRTSLVVASILLLSSLFLLFFKGFRNGEINPEYFLISGFGLLPGLIFLADWLTRKLTSLNARSTFTLGQFTLHRLAAERSRNMMIVGFLATGIFMVFSTGLNRKEVTKNADKASSGTGGFNYFVETSIPILANPETHPGRMDLDLPAEATIVSFQVKKGDDASCLNLNRILQPEIIACNPAEFDRRSSFTFVSSSSELNALHPWLSLEQTLEGGLLPAIADQGVIQWGMGKSVGDTLFYKDEEGRELRLKLIGGLAGSVLQGKVIISAENFSRAFPSVSGSSLFLLDLPGQEKDMKELKSSWHSYGPEVVTTKERLITFYSVESTYLHIFLLLGAIALLIGTLGLGILLYRITVEQLPEYALLSSLGFQKSQLFRLLMVERLFLILVAVLVGIIPALLSSLPSLTSPLYASLWVWPPVILILVILSGLAGSFVAIKLAFRQRLAVALRSE